MGEKYGTDVCLIGFVFQIVQYVKCPSLLMREPVF